MPGTTSLLVSCLFHTGFLPQGGPEAVSRRAERASNLTFSKSLHLVDLNNPRILMTHDKMAVTANIRA